MDRDDVIATLRAHEPELRHRGALHAALFGSLARNEAEPASVGRSIYLANGAK